MKNCFVIQPFDNGKFDKRYKETFSQAIKKAGLEPYRVDNDPSVVIPIEEIHEKIKKSEIVFAEITLDNPNVWYELGYAMASKKDIVMICSDERNTQFPFDIRHRAIIKYDTQAQSDFTKLEKDIIDKLIALIEKRATINEFESKSTLIKEREGLSEAERLCLAIILANQLTDEDSVTVYTLTQEMDKEGYTSLATSLALRKLRKKEFISMATEHDYNGNEYPVLRILQTGEEWIIEHESEFKMKTSKEDSKGFSQKKLKDDEFPF